MPSARHASLEEQVTHLTEEIHRLVEAPGGGGGEPPKRDGWDRWGRVVTVAVTVGGLVVWIIAQIGFISVTPRESVAALEQRIANEERTMLDTQRRLVILEAGQYFANTILCRSVRERDLVGQCNDRGLRAAVPLSQSQAARSP
jgi:hypothetical protein